MMARSQSDSEQSARDEVGRYLLHHQASEAVSDEYNGPPPNLLGQTAAIRKPFEQVFCVVMDVELGHAQCHAGVVSEEQDP